jgi:beta-phosphoglucomutase family hydrolase
MIEKIRALLKRMDASAVIFDLDGTLVDNNAFHLQSWKQYIKNLGKEISEEEYNANINGRTNKDAAEYLFGKKMTKDEAMVYALEKEAVYRDMYAPHIKPVKGLIEMLDVLKKLNIPMAIATSGIQVNIDFMFDHIPIREYFSVVVNSAHINKGKPDPEIYLKAAELLEVAPESCLVFEDAVVGINSAKAAGMRVVAISTTHPEEELSGADLIVNDYTELF